MVVKKLKKLVSQLVSSDSAATKANKEAASKEEAAGKAKVAPKRAVATKKDLAKTDDVAANAVELSTAVAKQQTPSGNNKENNMTDSTTANATTANASAATHSYLEVAGELLSKPTTLCDLLESRAAPKTLVFCNSPSDTDFVDVMIRKRGLSSAKLIGFVSPEKTASIGLRLASGDLVSVVATDIAARGLDFSQFELIVNYSLPQDSGSYEERSGGAAYGGEIVSIVSPLDLTNFMQLKKALGIDFKPIDLPAAKDLSKAKVSRLVKSAQNKASEISENAQHIAAELLKDENKQLVVSYLVAQSLEIIPQLQSQIEKLTLERQLEEDGAQPGAHAGGRWARDERGGQDRDGAGRDDRGGDRRQQDRRGGRGGDDDRRGGGDRQPRADSNNRGDNKRGDNNNGRQRRRFDDQDSGGQEDQRDQAPRKQVIRQKDERIYFGQGSDQGFSADKLTELITTIAGLPAESLRRVSVRPTYSFADVGEGVSETLIPTLSETDVAGGKKLFCVRAATIVTSETTDAPATGAEGQLSDGRRADEGTEDEATPQDAAASNAESA